MVSCLNSDSTIKEKFWVLSRHLEKYETMETTASLTDTQKSVDDFAGERLYKENALAMMAKHNVTLPEYPDRNEYGFLNQETEIKNSDGFMGSQGTERVIKQYLTGLYEDKVKIRMEDIKKVESEIQEKEGENLQLQVLLRDYQLDLEKIEVAKDVASTRRGTKQKELLAEEPALLVKVKEIEELRLPALTTAIKEGNAKLKDLKSQAEDDEREKKKAMEFASISAHAVQKATGSIFEDQNFRTSTPFKTATKVQPGAFTRVEAGIDMGDKEKLLVSGGRIIQVGEDGKVGEILTPNWKDYGARKNFKIYFEELYLYLLKLEYVETEVVLEIVKNGDRY